MSNWYRVWSIYVLWCGCWIHCQAQFAVWADSIVDLQISKRPLKKVLKDLSDRYALQFSYADDHLSLNRKITFYSKGETLEQTLKQLFDKNDILFAYIGQQLVLKPNTARTRKQEQRRRRRERRQVREQQTLERRRLFKKDWHPNRTPKPIPPDRKLYPTTPITPLVVTEIGNTTPVVQEQITQRTDQVPFKKVVRPRIAQVSFFPNVSTNPCHDRTIHIGSFNLLWSQNGGLFGMEVGVLGNELTRSMQGLQLAGGYNWVKGDAYGLQASGLFSYNKGNLYGMQLAGLFTGNNDTHGMQLAGLGNFARTLYGTQIGALSNIATDVYGFQFSGLTNFANGTLFGAQVAGVGNLAWGGKSAVQIAGLFNYSATAQSQIAIGFNIAQLIDGVQLGAINAAKDVHGAQVGAVNYTRALDGVQLGFLNIANQAQGTMIGLINIVDSIRGVPIGLINVVKKNGYTRIELSTGDVLYCSLGAKMGVPRLYYMVQFGWQVNASNDYVWSAGVGVGTAVPLHPRWDLHIEWLTSHINEGVVWTPSLNLLHQLKPTVAYRLSERVSWFMGPSFNLLVSNSYHQDTGGRGSTLAPYSLFDTNNSRGVNFKGWIGGTMGLRF